jgi:hypothetical protein
MLAAVAVVIPREHGVPAFLLGPCGLGLLALLVVLLASFVEEGPGLRRIRLASRLRLGALAVLAASGAWALAVHEPANLRFGLGVAAVAALFLAPAVLYDLAALRDPRLGEPVWCERLGEHALELASVRGSLPVRYDRIVRLDLGALGDEHGVLVTVRERTDASGPVSLHWAESGRDGDSFLLTERQLGADAATFALRLEAARAAGGYR